MRSYGKIWPLSERDAHSHYGIVQITVGVKLHPYLSMSQTLQLQLCQGIFSRAESNGSRVAGGNSSRIVKIWVPCRSPVGDVFIIHRIFPYYGSCIYAATVLDSQVSRLEDARFDVMRILFDGQQHEAESCLVDGSIVPLWRNDICGQPFSPVPACSGRTKTAS